MSKRGTMQPIGELPLLKELAKKYKPPTKAQHQLIEAGLAIREAPDAAERAFMARQLVLCTLPHTDPGNVEVWKRKTGNGGLLIQQGFDYDSEKALGYPFGVIPRLLLYWITSEVQLTKNRDDLSLDDKRKLYLGRSLAAFMRDVGLNPDNGTGKRSDARRLHDQMERLFASRISFHQTTNITDELQRKRRLNMDVAPQSELWWNPKTPEQGALWESWIRIGLELYEALIESPVPLDMRALRALKRSPLALDLYAWSCYRAFVIVQRQQPPQFMAWSLLQQQLGGDYSDPKDFKRKAKAAFRKIRTVYPGLAIAEIRGGFTIHATRLAVPLRDSPKALR